MRRIAVAIALLVPLFLSAQAPADDDGAEAASAAAEERKEALRDTSGYAFPPLSRTVRGAQFMAYAMTLRDYCSDQRVDAAFVQERLARFAVMTGREETCASLSDY